MIIKRLRHLALILVSALGCLTIPEMPQSTLELEIADIVPFDAPEMEIDIADAELIEADEIPVEDQYEDVVELEEVEIAVEDLIEAVEVDIEEVEIPEEVEEIVDAMEIEEELVEDLDIPDIEEYEEEVVECTPIDCVPLFPTLKPCEKAVQNKETCLCEMVPKANGEKCDDLLVCTKDDACFDGVCSGILMPPSVCYCSKHSDCEVYDDGNKCNGLQFCDMDHRCKPQFGSTVICNTLKDTECLKNLCNPATGICSMTPVNEGGSCNDNNLCTYNERCVGGYCMPESVKVCNDNDPCTTDVCDPVSGECVFTGPQKPQCPLEGACSQGVDIVCIDNQYKCDFSAVSGYMSEDLLCDGKDNDCDGLTDETFKFTDWDGSKKSLGDSCGTGECVKGIVICNEAQSGVVCSTMHNSSSEKCDLKDNDCDGKTDSEDAVDLAANDFHYCEKQSGVCFGAAKPAYLCISGEWQQCSTTEYSSHNQVYEEIETMCDGVDNDCNGALDEKCPLIFVFRTSNIAGMIYDETATFRFKAGVVSTPSAVVKNPNGWEIRLGFLPDAEMEP